MITLFLKTSSLEKPLVSLDSLKSLTQSSKNTQRSNQKNLPYLNPTFERKSVIDFERNDVSDRKRRDRFRRICPLCSKCCCFASTIALLLLLMGLAALLVFLLMNRHTTTTTTTTTTTKTSEFFIQKSISNFSLVIQLLLLRPRQVLPVLSDSHEKRNRPMNDIAATSTASTTSTSTTCKASLYQIKINKNFCFLSDHQRDNDKYVQCPKFIKHMLILFFPQSSTYVATTSTSSTSTSNSSYVYALCKISFFVIHRFNIYHMYVEIFEYKIEIQLFPLCIHKHKRLQLPQVSVRIKKILFSPSMVSQ